MRRRTPALALLLAALVPGPAPARAEHALELSADTAQTGWIGLRLHGRPGTTVTIGEQLGSQVRPLGEVVLSTPDADLRRVTRWRCDRLTRTFVATAPGPLGTTESATAQATTRSCRRRLGARVRRRGRAGRAVRVRLRDRFGVGNLPVSVCIAPPAARRRCSTVRIPPGERAVSHAFRAFRPGRWRVRVGVKGGRPVRRTVRVAPRRGRLRVLATGDSMIQVVDSFLAQRLGARVRSDARVSTGISKPGMFDWVRHARRQAARRPDVTIVFIGANDGFPIGDAACCGRAWIKRYARRVRRMMAAYKRGRAGVVYWLMLPTPRDRSFARVFGPVNRALRRAVRSFGPQVRLIDLRRTFTPDGRFHRVIRYRGRTVVARQDDGVHLSTAGASIAAGLVIRALRRDRIL